MKGIYMLWYPMYDYLNMALHDVYYLLEAANVVVWKVHW